MMRLMALVLATLLWLPVTNAWAASNTLNNVRAYDAPDHLRIVLDFSNKPDYSTFKLSKPHRLVFDIKNTKSVIGQNSISEKSRRINSFRHSNNPASKVARVVFEVAQYAKSNVFTLPPQGNYKHRLVIDLYDRDKPKGPTIIKQDDNSGERDIVIAIDAGHGGEDPGSIGFSGTYEKHVTLKMAKQLASIINKEPGMRAGLTRSGDYFVRLQTRTNRARKLKADLLVSIHADAFTTPQPSGASVWLLSIRRSETEVGRVLEQKEKRSELLGGVPEVMDSAETDKYMAKTVLDLMQTNSMQSGYYASQHVLSKLATVTKLHKSKPQHASLAVLTAPDIPSLLVETGFISNRRDEMNLNSKAHREKLMKAIFSGIKNYFQDKPPENSLWAKWKNLRREHKVKRGDSLSVLANRYNVSVTQLKNVNKLRSDVLKIGQVLVIPRGS